MEHEENIEQGTRNFEQGSWKIILNKEQEENIEQGSWKTIANKEQGITNKEVL